MTGAGLWVASGSVDAGTVEATVGTMESFFASLETQIAFETGHADTATWGRIAAASVLALARVLTVRTPLVRWARLRAQRPLIACTITNNHKLQIKTISIIDPSDVLPQGANRDGKLPSTQSVHNYSHIKSSVHIYHILIISWSLKKLQKENVLPLGHLQLPSSGSHSAPFLHSHLFSHFSPQKPCGQAEKNIFSFLFCIYSGYCTKNWKEFLPEPWANEVSDWAANDS